MTLGKPTRTQSLVDYLRQLIVEGKIASGDKLPSENELVAEHGVSRTVVREALLRLQTGGYIHTRRGAGSYALVPPSEMVDEGTFPVARSMEDRVHLLSFRAAVESEAAALCARGASNSTLSSLQSAIARFEESLSVPSRAMSCDFDFHLTVAIGSGNPYIVSTLRALGPAMIAMPQRRLEFDGGREVSGESSVDRVAEEHRSIFRAIKEGDQLVAATAMRSHLTNSKFRLTG
ncbi:MAG: FadR/GntR family transcriptional regulator [Micrococcaceae bacterium]